jgi:NADH:ubiquinone oxidoreductase subunit F (NADH-binding)
VTGRLHLVDSALRPGLGQDGRGALLGAAVSYPAGAVEPISNLRPSDLDEHLDTYRVRPAATGAVGDRLLHSIDHTGLTGHGGGHFPVAAKWRAHLQAGGGGTVIANAAESEPASEKDHALLQYRPHLVLDGLAGAAQAVGADDVVVWLHAGAERTHRAVSRALAERRGAGMAEPAVRVVSGPDGYLSGESSAIIRSLSGGPALPSFRRAPATTAGVGGRPTLVHNVETLARVGLIRNVGAEYQPGTLLTVSHADVCTVLEVTPDAALGPVLQAMTGLRGRGAPQAVLVGGYGGTWMPWARLATVPADPRRLRALGIALGAGVLVPVADGECGLAVAVRVLDYLAANSARQCGPCLFGLRSVADLFRELVHGRTRRRDLTRLHRFLTEITGRGGCHHPDGAVRMVSSAVTTFGDDADSHLRHGRCLHPGSAPTVELAGIDR